MSIGSQEPDETETNNDHYAQALYSTGRYALGFSLLVGMATVQSLISQKVKEYPLLTNATSYVFMPLTFSLSMLIMTPLQSRVGKYLHGAFAPPDSLSEKIQSDDSLEGLWFRTYQAYSMNAQMSRNVVLGLNTLSFFYLDRIQKYLETGQIEAGLFTQAHFFRMAEKYFAEIPLNSPIWEDVFTLHAKIIWLKHRGSVVDYINREDFSESALQLFYQRVLDIDDWEECK